MNRHATMSQTGRGFAAAFLAAAALALSGLPAHAAGDPAQVLAQGFAQRPGNLPVTSLRLPEFAAKWWQWAYSFPLAQIPFFNKGGPVDASAGQSGNVWFLAGANQGLTTPRVAVIPTGIHLFLPIANLINDYPCPPAFGFEPNPGESIEHFLQRTGNEFMPVLTDLFAELDGVPLQNLAATRATSPMFIFTADPALASTFDPCVTGTPQPGVGVGYWLLIRPLPPGIHTLHFGSPTWGQDVSYVLDVGGGAQ